MAALARAQPAEPAVPHRAAGERGCPAPVRADTIASTARTATLIAATMATAKRRRRDQETGLAGGRAVCRGLYPVFAIYCVFPWH